MALGWAVWQCPHLLSAWLVCAVPRCPGHRQCRDQACCPEGRPGRQGSGREAEPRLGGGKDAVQWAWRLGDEVEGTLAHGLREDTPGARQRPALAQTRVLGTGQRKPRWLWGADQGGPSPGGVCSFPRELSRDTGTLLCDSGCVTAPLCAVGSSRGAGDACLIRLLQGPGWGLGVSSPHPWLACHRLRPSFKTVFEVSLACDGLTPCPFSAVNVRFVSEASFTA